MIAVVRELVEEEVSAEDTSIAVAASPYFERLPGDAETSTKIAFVPFNVMSTVELEMAYKEREARFKEEKMEARTDALLPLLVEVADPAASSRVVVFAALLLS